VPNAKIRIRPATRASDWEDEQWPGIVLAKSLRPSIPFVSNINLTEEFRGSGHGSAYRMTQATIPQTNCTGELNPRPAPLPRRWAADDPVPVFRFLRSSSQDSITSFHGRMASDVIHV